MPAVQPPPSCWVDPPLTAGPPTLQKVLDCYGMPWEFLCTCYGCQYALSRVGACGERATNSTRPSVPTARWATGRCGRLPSQGCAAAAAAAAAAACGAPRTHRVRACSPPRVLCRQLLQRLQAEGLPVPDLLQGHSEQAGEPAEQGRWWGGAARCCTVGRGCTGGAQPQPPPPPRKPESALPPCPQGPLLLSACHLTGCNVPVIHPLPAPRRPPTSPTS
jgi:hypothetical protein